MQTVQSKVVSVYTVDLLAKQPVEMKSLEDFRTQYSEVSLDLVTFLLHLGWLHLLLEDTHNCIEDHYTRNLNFLL